MTVQLAAIQVLLACGSTRLLTIISRSRSKTKIFELILTERQERGGQHVNKTDSAIRITHMPTNIVVQCQNDRSQHRNRATAFNMLKARLYERELQRREDAANDAASGKTDIGWGNQIRSYVLHPYQMVKDLRTNVEKGNAQGVLDGDLDDFIEASLAARVGNQR